MKERRLGRIVATGVLAIAVSGFAASRCRQEVIPVDPRHFTLQSPGLTSFQADPCQYEGKQLVMEGVLGVATDTAVRVKQIVPFLGNPLQFERART